MRASAFSWKGQEFEGSDESLCLQLEGARVGSYNRIETKEVLCEFIENFDPLTVIHNVAILFINPHMEAT